MIELLAPAGNFQSLRAAVEAGANAVYLAGNNFGARAYAGNFNDSELIQAVEFAHLRDVAVHVTVNTIVNDDEIKNLIEYLKFLEKIHVDAILIQDLGAASIAKKYAPGLPLHASTQMTVHSVEGVKFLESMGFSRIVLARELSISEIKNICEHATAEIEIFMHGALCVCYSGQCLMSSMIGARSGNRGQCAQPCRLPYELVDENDRDLLNGKAGKYLLSPKDLNTIDILPQLIETGISSLKIEGRMKRPEYVAIVVETYRRTIDRFYENPTDYKVNIDENHRLAQIFNRDFTTAYLENIPGKTMISDKKPNNRGLLIGRVAKVDKNAISIKLAEKINLGDQLEIWVKVGGRVTITVENLNVDGDICTIQTDAQISGVKLHDRVFKIFDAELTAHAREFFTSNAPVRRIAVDAEVSAKLNEPLYLKFVDAAGNVAEVTTKINAVEAKNQPLTEDIIKKQLSRLGTTIYKLNRLTTIIDDNIMIPVSELNEARRRAVEILNDLRLRRVRNISPASHLPFRSTNFQKPSTQEKFFQLSVAVDNLEMMKLAIKSGADCILFGGESYHHETILPAIYHKAIDIVRNANKKIYIGTPRIVRDAEQPDLEKILQSTNEADGIYVHNVATLNLARRLTSLPIYTDFSLIAYNSSTIDFLREVGVCGVTLSPELTFNQIKFLAQNSSLPLECIVHGRTELMISSYCVIGSFIGGVGERKCPQPCRKNKFHLRDRKSAIFPIVTDQFCRMHILNGKILSMLPYASDFAKIGVSKIRIDARAMSAAEMQNTIKNYRFAIEGETVTEGDNITRGHYFRGVENHD